MTSIDDQRRLRLKMQNQGNVIMSANRLSTSTIYSLIQPSSWAREIPLLAAFNLLLVGSAFLSINLPWTPVPITGQTFAVMLLAMSLGRVRAGIVTAAYLLEGAIGLPVFAGGAFGVATLFGPTGGYLMGFLIAAVFVGWLADQGWDRSVWRSLLAMSIGHAIIFEAGLLILSIYVPAGQLLAAGLTPFLLGTAIKILLASGILPAMWAWLGKSK